MNKKVLTQPKYIHRVVSLKYFSLVNHELLLKGSLEGCWM